MLASEVFLLNRKPSLADRAISSVWEGGEGGLGQVGVFFLFVYSFFLKFFCL